MGTLQKKTGIFHKVGECLYRYSSNGVYYARVKASGKEIKRSLETTDRPTAQRKLAAFKEEQRQVDRSQGKCTLRDLCERYLKTIGHLRPKTIAGKTLFVRRIQNDWPTGEQTQILKVKPSDVELWLARYEFGTVSRNQNIGSLRELFEMALRDNIISRSPVAHLRWTKPKKPIRLTPTFGQFRAIIADVRAQQFNADARDSADFLEFLGLAGLGQAEAGSLTRADVDLEAGRIITFRHKTSTGFAIPIFPQVRPILERLCNGKSGTQHIFKIRDAKKSLAGACHRLQLSSYTQRSLRRMFITRAIERGVDVKVIAEWQGHKDGGKLILDTYSHVNRTHSQRMAQLMIEDEPANVVPMTSAA